MEWSSRAPLVSDAGLIFSSSRRRRECSCCCASQPKIFPVKLTSRGRLKRFQLAAGGEIRSSKNVDPVQPQTSTLDSSSENSFGHIPSDSRYEGFDPHRTLNRCLSELKINNGDDLSPEYIKYIPRSYNNKFIRWVKLGSVINDAALAFFKSEVRRRTFVTVALLMICRAGQFVPLPGFNRSSMPSDVLALATSLPADGEHIKLPKMSFFQLGLSPYICASTIIHLVCSWYPPFQKMRKEGEMEKIKSYMWWLTLSCALFQSFLYAYATLEYSVAKNAFKHVMFTAGLLTSGAMLLEWISRKITEAGFGQGSTLIICMGILVSSSHSLRDMVVSFSRTNYSQWGPALMVYIGVFLIMTACAVLVTEGRRIIKLQFYGFDRFPSSGSGDGGVAEVEPYIPFDINPNGMLPVYMASYIMAVPGFLANILNIRLLRRLQILLNPALPPAPGAKPWLYHTMTAALILVFSIIDVSDGAKDISEYINRIGAKIADVKPGRSTIEFLRKVQNSSRAWGGLLLALLVTVSTLVDYKLRSLHQTGGISFTSMLFIVGTIIEVRRSFMAYHAMHTLSKVLRRYGV